MNFTALKYCVSEIELLSTKNKRFLKKQKKNKEKKLLTLLNFY